MIKVYQKKIDKEKGDCMQAVFASLFNKKLEEVPAFIELGKHWHRAIDEFAKQFGYKWEGMLHNRKYSIFTHPLEGCFKERCWHEPVIMSPHSLEQYNGINGLFYATVLSPKYFDRKDPLPAMHAVIIDKEYNIIHDPNPENKDILAYPLAELLDYQGIVSIHLYEKH